MKALKVGFGMFCWTWGLFYYRNFSFARCDGHACVVVCRLLKREQLLSTKSSLLDWKLRNILPLKNPFMVLLMIYVQIKKIGSLPTIRNISIFVRVIISSTWAYVGRMISWQGENMPTLDNIWLCIFSSNPVVTIWIVKQVLLAKLVKESWLKDSL